MTRANLRAFLLLLVLGLGPVAAAAESMTFFGDFDAISDGNSYTSDDPFDPNSFFLFDSSVVGIPKFDPTLGTLTDIIVSINGNNPILIDVFADLDAEQADEMFEFFADAYVEADAGLYYETPDPSIITLISEDASLGASCGGGMFEGGCFDSVGYPSSVAGTVSILDDVDLADFVGAGDVEKLLIGLFLGVSAEFLTDNVTLATFDTFFDIYTDGAPEQPVIELTYVYTPIPIPAAWLLLAPALLMLTRRPRG